MNPYWALRHWGWRRRERRAARQALLALKLAGGKVCFVHPDDSHVATAVIVDADVYAAMCDTVDRVQDVARDTLARVPNPYDHGHVEG